MDTRSKELRKKIILTALAGGRGHIPSAFSIVEILRVLYDDVLRPNDHFILSKGHGCLALYVMLADKGIITQRDLDKFCHADGILGGHPSHHIPGVEFSTGSLGHGLSLGMGLALAKPEDRVYVLMGDGECQEGQVHEAAIDAGYRKISNLAAIVDHNQMQSYGKLAPDMEGWFSRGWFCVAPEGHTIANLRWAFEMFTTHELSDMPHLIRCDTVKGYGLPSLENNAAAHHLDKFTQEQADKLLAELEAQP